MNLECDFSQLVNAKDAKKVAEMNREHRYTQLVTEGQNTIANEILKAIDQGKLETIVKIEGSGHLYDEMETFIEDITTPFISKGYESSIVDSFSFNVFRLNISWKN